MHLFSLQRKRTIPFLRPGVSVPEIALRKPVTTSRIAAVGIIFDLIFISF